MCRVEELNQYIQQLFDYWEGKNDDFEPIPIPKEVDDEEKAAVAACASDYFEKYNNIPETLKGTETENIVDAVLAELEKRSNAAAQAEEQRIEAEKQEILKDLYLYGM